jgi:hypothetical protein
VTDVNTTAPAVDEDLFDEASEEFASKEDFKDRLVAVWVTGKKGTRQNADGKEYGWVETITLALDDGPDGESATQLVGSAPARQDNLQWSTEGMVSRLLPRITIKDANGNPIYRPMIGRVNSRKNKVKGRSDSWSIASPTDEDKAVAVAHGALLASITAEVKAARETTDDTKAFD